MCGVKCYASAQLIDFLALAKNFWFPNQKQALQPSGVSGWPLIIEDRQETEAVIEEMQAYQGSFAAVDAEYLRGLALRRSAIMQKVKERISRLENPTHIICQDGQCAAEL